MASSGYMTEETDVESMWGAILTTAQFALINVRMGEILNFTVRPDKDAQTDVTDTRVIPLLEQLSEEGMFELLQASKTNKFNDVWRFIQSKAIWVMSKLLFQNSTIIDEIKEVLEANTYINYSNLLRLPSHRDDRSLG